MNDDDKAIISQQIDEWLRRQTILPSGDHGRASKILLRHLSVDNKVQGDLGTFQVKVDPGSVNLGSLTSSIAEAAQKDADDLAQGIQKYALYAIFPDDLNYFPRKVFRVAASNDDFERDLSPSEPPTEKGLVSQLMRHTESIMKTMTVHQSYTTGILQRENQRLVEMNEKYSQQQVDFMVLLQDTMDQSHSRRLNEKKDEAALAMKETIISKLESLVPVIINRIAGQTVIPVEDPSFILMGTLLEGLSTEQQMNFLNSLDEGQKPLFAEMLSAYEKKKATSMGTKKNLISQGIGVKTGLPPAHGEEPLQISAPKDRPPADDNSDLLAPEGHQEQHPLFKTVKDRMAEHPTLLSDDPVIATMEQKAKNFAARFGDMMLPTKKKPTTGDK